MTYTPRTRPLIPVGHRCWLAVSRVRTPPSTKPFADFTVDETIEWLLEQITAPGHDVSQRHDDLVTLAELVIKTRGNKVPFGRNGYTWDGSSEFGHGVKPIDSDTHDPDCRVCGDAPAYAQHGHEPDFDPHPYDYAPSEEAQPA
jgi:hypothetical protein